MKSYFLKINSLLFIILVICLGFACNKDDNMDNCQNCELEPKVGPCDAAIPRYYFDKDENKCKEFIWGGCEGVVPFQTMEECELCKCTN